MVGVSSHFGATQRLLLHGLCKPTRESSSVHESTGRSTMIVLKNIHPECWQLGNKLHGITSQINSNHHDNLKSVILIAIPHLTLIHIHHDDNVNDCKKLSFTGIVELL